MTTSDALDVLQFLVAFAPAVLASRRDPAFVHVARALGLNLASDAAQRLLALAYVGTGRPYAGLPRLAFHLAQASHLAWPALALWLAWRAFGRRPRAAPPLALWSVATAGAVAVYPWPSPTSPSPAYAAAQVVAVVVEAVLLGAWVARGEGLTPLRWVGLAVVAGELARLLCPYLAAVALGQDVASAWDLSTPSRAAVWLAVGVVACRTWTAGSSRCSPSSSPSRPARLPSSHRGSGRSAPSSRPTSKRAPPVTPPL